MKFVAAARQTWQHPTRRLAIVLIGVSMALGTPLYSMVSVVAENKLHISVSAYGTLIGLYGMGAVAGNLLNSRLRGPRSSRLLCVLTLFGVAVITVGTSTSFLLTAIAIFVAGSSYLLASVTLMTCVQLATPNYLRGRVVAIYSFAYVGAVPLGNLIQGWVASLVGVSMALAMAGTGLLLLAGWLKARPDLALHLNIERPEDIDLTSVESVPTTRDSQSPLRV